MNTKRRGTLPESLCEKYRSGMTLTALAEEQHWPVSTLRLWLINSGVTMRTHAEAVRASVFDLGSWLKGKKRGPMRPETREKLRQSRIGTGRGFSVTVNGYVKVTTGPNKHRGAHTVLMEGIIGRRITQDEVVHHIDGNKHNNHPDNLQLMTRAAHTSLHRKNHAKSQ